jgi:hypothetical protein
MVPGGLHSIVYRDMTLPTETAGELLHPHQRVETLAPSLREKRGNLQHNKNPSRGNISSISISEEYCWSSRRKNSKPQLQGHEGLKP